MKLEVTWKGRTAFEADSPSGARFSMESDGKDGPTPIEAFIASLAACSAMDVVSILAKMRQPVEAYRVEVEWERGPKGEWPRPVTAVTVRHVVNGQGIDPAAVEKAVRLSDEKYCSVSATLRTPPNLQTVWEIEG